MTRTSLSWVLMLWISLHCACSPAGSSDTSGLQNQTRTIGSLLQDEAGDIHETFVITNPSPKTVKLTNVSNSCSCTSASLEASELKPGESTVLHMRGDWSRRQGMMTMITNVATEQGSTSTYEVRCKIVPRAALTPDGLAFGSLAPEAKTDRKVTIRVTSREASPPRPTIRFASPVPYIGIEPGIAKIKATDDGMFASDTEVIVNFEGNSGVQEVGPSSTRLLVETSPEFPTVELPITWAVQAQVVVDPPRAFFTGLEAGDSPEHILALTRVDGTPFRITKVVTSNPAFHCETPSGNQSLKQKIHVGVDPDRVKHFAFGTLEVTIDTSTRPVAIPLAAIRKSGGSDRQGE